MKYGHLLLVLHLFLLCGLLSPGAGAQSTQGAQVPVFEPYFSIHWNGGVIHQDQSGAVPCVADWDGDNVKDLLVGTYTTGYIYFYHNYGTNAAPVFQDRVALQAGSTTIKLSAG
jgi:hypothetical protein